MFNQNFEDAHFNFHQVEKMLAQLRSDRGPDAKPVLLVLHQRRVRGGPANSHSAVRLIQSWKANSASLCTRLHRYGVGKQLTPAPAALAQTSCSPPRAARMTTGTGCTRQ